MEIIPKNPISIETRAQNKETKWLIFTKALDLFSLYGIEAVSMRNISDAVGIKVASIYNHFSSKEELVNEMYAYYEQKNRPVEEYAKELEVYGQVAQPEDYLSKSVVYISEEDNLHITKILNIAMSRMRTDERALKLVEKQFVQNFEKMKNVLYKMQEQGKLKDTDIDVFIDIYRHMSFSASYNLNTPLSVSFEQWQKMNTVLFSLLS